MTNAVVVTGRKTAVACPRLAVWSASVAMKLAYLLVGDAPRPTVTVAPVRSFGSPAVSFTDTVNSHRLPRMWIPGKSYKFGTLFCSWNDFCGGGDRGSGHYLASGALARHGALDDRNLGVHTNNRSCCGDGGNRSRAGILRRQLHRGRVDSSHADDVSRRSRPEYAPDQVEERLHK